MTKSTKAHIKETMPWYGGIVRKNRYSDQVKDKAWSLLSDYVRCRDVAKYGTCVATGERINNWRDCDAGHYYNMGAYGALLGFDDMNVHAQSKRSNMLSSFSDGPAFKEEIIRRHGKEEFERISKLKGATVKADEIFFIGKLKDTWGKFQKLKGEYPDFDYPDYIKSYQRVPIVPIKRT